MPSYELAVSKPQGSTTGGILISDVISTRGQKGLVIPSGMFLQGLKLSMIFVLTEPCKRGILVL